MHCSLVETTLLGKKTTTTENCESHSRKITTQTHLSNQHSCDISLAALLPATYGALNFEVPRGQKLLPLTDTKPTYLTASSLGFKNLGRITKGSANNKKEFTDMMSFFNDHNVKKDISISSELPGLVKVSGYNSCLLRVSE